MKKVIAVALVLLMLCVFPASAFAMEANSTVSSGDNLRSSGLIQPMWENVLSVAPTINTIDNTYTCAVLGLSGTSRISCTMVLYQKGLFGYTEVDRASGSSNSRTYTFSDGYSYQSGKTYKMEASITVTRNGTNETISVYTEKTV